MDIYVSFVYFGISLSLLLSEILDLIALFPMVLFIFIGLIILILGKRVITIPRIGLVRFGIKRKIKKIGFILLLLLPVIFLMFINIVLRFFPIDVIFSAVILGIAYAIPFIGYSYLTKLKRYYYYSIIIGIGFFMYSMFINNTGTFLYGPLVIIFVSSTIFIIGLRTISHFIKNFPKTKKEE